MVIGVVLVVLAVVALTAAVLAGASVRVLREYERGIVFRLGRVIQQKGPGLTLLIPAVDRMVRVSLRTVTLRIPHQEVITRDNVPVKVAAVVYFRVIDPTRSVVEVEDYVNATLQIAQTTLRSVLGKAELDVLLAERERLNESLQQIIDEHTEPWGIKVSVVEIKDVEIPDRMQSAHRAPGRGGAQQARQGDQLRRRVSGRGQARRGGGGDRAEPGDAAAALPAGAHGDQLQSGIDDRLSATDRHGAARCSTPVRRATTTRRAATMRRARTALRKLSARRPSLAA